MFTMAGMKALAMWQGGDGLNSGQANTLMIFVIIAALALVLQAGVFIVMAIGAAKAQKRMAEIAEEVRAAALPVISKSNLLLDELGPKVREIATNVAEITTMAKAKAREIEPTVSSINRTVEDTNRKTHAQMTRLDGMVTSALDATAELAAMVHASIRGPVLQAAGVVSGIKAGIESLAGYYVRMLRPAEASSASPSSNSHANSKVRTMPVVPAPDAAAAAAAEARNERSFAEYREAMQAKRKDLDLS